VTFDPDLPATSPLPVGRGISRIAMRAPLVAPSFPHICAPVPPMMGCDPVMVRARRRRRHLDLNCRRWRRWRLDHLGRRSLLDRDRLNRDRLRRRLRRQRPRLNGAASDAQRYEHGEPGTESEMSHGRGPSPAKGAGCRNLFSAKARGILWNRNGCRRAACSAPAARGSTGMYGASRTRVPRPKAPSMHCRMSTPDEARARRSASGYFTLLPAATKPRIEPERPCRPEELRPKDGTCARALRPGAGRTACTRRHAR
jgi:hypothetical protein